MTINVPTTIPSGQPTSGSCIASGNMYSRRPAYFFIRIRLVGHNEGDCSIEHIGRFRELEHAHYQQDFNITCNHGNFSVGIQCFTHINDETTKVNVQGTRIPKYVYTMLHLY